VRAAVDDVVQTATMVVKNRFTPREAVTIFATLTRDALPAARELRRSHPEQADTYRELILAVGRELRRMEKTSNEPRHLRALTEDLARVLSALG
jgi:hypothetical protein